MVIPSPLLPCRMATTTGRPFTIWLRRPPLPMKNEPSLIVAPSAAVPANTAGSSSSSVSVGSADGVTMAEGSRSSASVEQGLDGCGTGPRPAGVGEPGTVDAAPLCVRAEHHLGMRGEILVDLHDAAAQVPALGIAQLRGRGRGIREGCVALGLFAGVSLASIHGDLNEVRPGGPRRHLAFRTALEHQHVDDHLRAGRRVHDPLRQTHGADQVGETCDVLARRGAGLVHCAGAADEQRDATRPEAGDRAGDEVVVEPQAERGRGGVGTDDAVRERRIADHQVEAAGEIAAGVVLAADAGFRVDRGGQSGPSPDRIRCR